MTPTPIHPWRLPKVPAGFEVSVKREDLVGSTLTGNKVCMCRCYDMCAYTFGYRK